MCDSVHEVFDARRLLQIALWAGTIILLAGCSVAFGEDTAATTTTGPAATFALIEDTPADETPTSNGQSDTIDDGPEDTTTTSEPAPASDDVDTSATTAPSTTQAETTTTAVPTPVADGSGCSPGGGALPDGKWYGFVRITNSDSLDFDLACRFTDENASLAQVEDGKSPTVVDDYYIRNNNPTIRVLSVDPDAPVEWYPSSPAAPETTTYDQWIGQRSPYIGIWVTTVGGQVAAINEQWAP